MNGSIRWNADGSATLLGRLCTRDGTGGASPVATEGALNVATDYSSPGSLTIAVYNVTTGNSTPTYSATLTPSAVLSALLTGGIYAPPNCGDARGCNLVIDLPPTAFPDAHHEYRAVLTAVTSGGTTGFGTWQGVAQPTAP